MSDYGGIGAGLIYLGVIAACIVFVGLAVCGGVIWLISLIPMEPQLRGILMTLGVAFCLKAVYTAVRRMLEGKQ